MSSQDARIRRKEKAKLLLVEGARDRLQLNTIATDGQVGRLFSKILLREKMKEQQEGSCNAAYDLLLLYLEAELYHKLCKEWNETHKKAERKVSGSLIATAFQQATGSRGGHERGSKEEEAGSKVGVDRETRAKLRQIERRKRRVVQRVLEHHLGRDAAYPVRLSSNFHGRYYFDACYYPPPVSMAHTAGDPLWGSDDFLDKGPALHIGQLYDSLSPSHAQLVAALRQQLLPDADMGPVPNLPEDLLLPAYHFALQTLVADALPSFLSSIVFTSFVQSFGKPSLRLGDPKEALEAITANVPDFMGEDEDGEEEEDAEDDEALELEAVSPSTSTSTSPRNGEKAVKKRKRRLSIYKLDSEIQVMAAVMSSNIDEKMQKKAKKSKEGNELTSVTRSNSMGEDKKKKLKKTEKEKKKKPAEASTGEMFKRMVSSVRFRSKPKQPAPRKEGLNTKAASTSGLVMALADDEEAEDVTLVMVDDEGEEETAQETRSVTIRSSCGALPVSGARDVEDLSPPSLSLLAADAEKSPSHRSRHHASSSSSSSSSRSKRSKKHKKSKKSRSGSSSDTLARVESPTNVPVMNLAGLSAASDEEKEDLTEDTQTVTLAEVTESEEGTESVLVKSTNLLLTIESSVVEETVVSDVDCPLVVAVSEEMTVSETTVSEDSGDKAIGDDQGGSDAQEAESGTSKEAEAKAEAEDENAEEENSAAEEEEEEEEPTQNVETEAEAPEDAADVSQPPEEEPVTVRKAEDDQPVEDEEDEEAVTEKESEKDKEAKIPAQNKEAKESEKASDAEEATEVEVAEEAKEADVAVEAMTEEAEEAKEANEVDEVQEAGGRNEMAAEKAQPNVASAETGSDDEVDPGETVSEGPEEATKLPGVSEPMQRKEEEEASGEIQTDEEVAVIEKDAKEVVEEKSPKQEEPKQEEPKQEEPKQVEPKQEEPKQEEPKQEENKEREPTPESKVADPVQENPTAEEPKQEDPMQKEAEPEELKQNELKKDEAKQQPLETEESKLEEPAEEEPKEELKQQEAKQEPKAEVKHEEPKQEPKQDEPKQEQPSKVEPEQKQPRKEEAKQAEVEQEEAVDPLQKLAALRQKLKALRTDLNAEKAKRLSMRDIAAVNLQDIPGVATGRPTAGTMVAPSSKSLAKKPKFATHRSRAQTAATGKAGQADAKSAETKAEKKTEAEADVQEEPKKAEKSPRRQADGSRISQTLSSKLKKSRSGAAS